MESPDEVIEIFHQVSCVLLFGDPVDATRLSFLQGVEAPQQ